MFSAIRTADICSSALFVIINLVYDQVEIWASVMSPGLICWWYV